MPWWPRRGRARRPLQKTLTLTLAEATVVRHVLHLGLQVGRHGGTLDDGQVAVVTRVADQLAVYG